MDQQEVEIYCEVDDNSEEFNFGNEIWYLT